MTRKRFNKLMMAVGLPRNELTKKLKAGDEYRDVLLVQSCFVLLDTNSDPMEIASAIMVLRAISHGKDKLIGQAYKVLAKYRAEQNPVKSVQILANASRFLLKHKAFVDYCFDYARETVGSFGN